jgi:hypothetical protein
MLITLLSGVVFATIPKITAGLKHDFNLLGPITTASKSAADTSLIGDKSDRASSSTSTSSNGVVGITTSIGVTQKTGQSCVAGRPGNPSASGLAHGTAADKCRPGKGQPGVYGQGGDP